MRCWTNISDQFSAWPTWSPDGRFLAFALLTRPIRGTALRILDTQDGTVRDPAPLLENWLTPASPARWSPDGTTVVFSRGRGQIAPDRSVAIVYELFLLRPGDGEFHQLTNLDGSANNPQWSPDGQRIFFDFAPEPCDPGHSLNRTTWVMVPDGSNPQQWPVNLGNPRVQFSYPFALSPDGAHVAFVGPDATGNYGVIHMMRLDGTGRKQLTFPPDSLSSAAVGTAVHFR
jgi:Tol biopolymer transport system component